MLIRDVCASRQCPETGKSFLSGPEFMEIPLTHLATVFLWKSFIIKKCFCMCVMVEGSSNFSVDDRDQQTFPEPESKYLEVCSLPGLLQLLACVVVRQQP